MSHFTTSEHHGSNLQFVKRLQILKFATQVQSIPQFKPSTIVNELIDYPSIGPFSKLLTLIRGMSSWILPQHALGTKRGAGWTDKTQNQSAASATEQKEILRPLNMADSGVLHYLGCFCPFRLQLLSLLSKLHHPRVSVHNLSTGGCCGN